MKQIWEYIISDYYRYYGNRGGYLQVITKALLARNHCFAYSFWMRLASRKNPFYIVARLMHYRLSRSYGIQISPFCKIGYGLYIGHGVGIIINGGTRIGNNCNISQFLSIGTNKGTPATIGNNVYIGPNVCIIEDVNIGDNSTIGAGSVVIKDVPINATVAGVPAQVIHQNHPAIFICNPYHFKK